MSSEDHDAWDGLTHYAGFDWGRKAHHVTVFDARGKCVLATAFDHDAAGWASLRDKLRALAGKELSVVGVAIETCRGPAVEKLLELGCAVYPMNPKAASRYRERHAPSGTKDDALDSASFGNALRTDGHRWRRLDPEDPLTQQIRLTCRDEASLVRRRSSLVCALREALHEYYPAALEAFDDWTSPSVWAFVQRFETPAKLARCGKKAWDKFLHDQRLYRPQTYDRRIEVFGRATELTAPRAVTEAKKLLALSLISQLKVLQKQLTKYRKAIDGLFDSHPSRAIFDSLPGAGEKLAPRLLGECAEATERYDSAKGLECCSGAAPIRFQSGQVSVTRMRRACIKPLRHAVHLWAGASLKSSVWARAYYDKKRSEGKTHACALRCLARRWLRILWKLLETGQAYDESVHLRNQMNRGNLVLRGSGS